MTSSHETRTQETSSRQGSPWSLGDYHRFAKSTVWEVGPVVVEACGIEAGQRVLDVAAGTGNVAIRAALRGAEVIASDITPENFPAGQAEAAGAGVKLGWVEADAQALPFADREFDVVTSCFGAIFAPNHQAVADELVRVCRAGGVIGMANFTPESLIGPFLELFAPYLPPPPENSSSPALWGSEQHVRDLFGDRVELEMTRRAYTERAASPEAYRELFLTTFGPAVAVRANLADDPSRAAEFESALLDFAVRSNASPSADRAEYPYEYLLVVGHKR